MAHFPEEQFFENALAEQIASLKRSLDRVLSRAEREQPHGYVQGQDECLTAIQNADKALSVRQLRTAMYEYFFAMVYFGLVTGDISNAQDLHRALRRTLMGE